MLLHSNIFISENKIIHMQLCLLDKRTPNYKMWQATLDADFGGGKFERFFHGPMWSGCDRKDVGDPRKVIRSYSLTFKPA